MKKITLIGLLLGVLACADLREGMMDENLSLNGGPQGPAGFAGDYGYLPAREWKLDAYETGRVSKNTVLEFKTQRNLAGNYILSGLGAVNFYEAGYSLTGNNTLKIVNLSMTEIGGSKEDMAFEKDYFERLASVNAFSFKDNRLTLKNGKGQEIIFK